MRERELLLLVLIVVFLLGFSIGAYAYRGTEDYKTKQLEKEKLKLEMTKEEMKLTARNQKLEQEKEELQEKISDLYFTSLALGSCVIALFLIFAYIINNLGL